MSAPTNYTPIEEEVILLWATVDLLDTMLNATMLSVAGDVDAGTR